jgi:hypothetical protein
LETVALPTVPIPSSFILAEAVGSSSEVTRLTGLHTVLKFSKMSVERTFYEHSPFGRQNCD